MLNWEKDKANHKAREKSLDYLPRTGSWADMRRWEIENNQSPVSRYRSNQQTKSNYSNSHTTDNLNQLSQYVKCINSAYFWKKSAKDRNEIITIIQKLIRRISDLNLLLTDDESKLVNKAKKILAEFSH
jgi:hypothetical protein